MLHNYSAELPEEDQHVGGRGHATGLLGATNLSFKNNTDNALEFDDANQNAMKTETSSLTEGLVVPSKDSNVTPRQGITTTGCKNCQLERQPRLQPLRQASLKSKPSRLQKLTHV